MLSAAEAAGREEPRGGTGQWVSPSSGSAQVALLPAGLTRSLPRLLQLSASRPRFLASLTSGPSLHTRVVSSRRAGTRGLPTPAAWGFSSSLC